MIGRPDGVPDPFSIAPPHHDCPVCGRLVLRFTFGDESELLWDPGFTHRRLIRSWLGESFVARRGYARLSDRGGVHQCPGPPAGPTTLRTAGEDVRRILGRLMGRGRGEGAVG